ncbi:hypothetical protein ACIP1G_17700 [Pseudomonas sp. NPDC089392]|uniref:hypothetical protein n=1 Tax=Pseudomonas sp. NPDC089392 TaxID=3364459 RepID=UPI00380BDE60
MPTPSTHSAVVIRTLEPTRSENGYPALAGKGNLLVAARQTLNRSATELRSLLSQAPDLQQTVHTALKTHLQISPLACGLRHGDSQVTLMTFASRLLAGPVFANPYTDWSTWGFDGTEVQANMSASQWATFLSPIINAAKLNAPRTYWEARMPGTDIARQAHADNLLRQHFTSSLDIAYGCATLGTNLWLQARQASARYAQLQWRTATGGLLTSTVALLIKPQAGNTQWLIYMPDRHNSVLPIADLEQLRDWVFENRFIFWSDPRSPITAGTRDDVLVTDVQGDGLLSFREEALLQHQAITDHHLLEACRQSETDPLDWAAVQAWENMRSAMVVPGLAPPIDTTIDAVIASDAALANEEVHFAGLEQHLPIGWRHQLVERQETLLEEYLGPETAVTSSKVTSLRERQAMLDQLQGSHDNYLLALPEPLVVADLQAQDGDTTRAERITEGLCESLLKEARLQHTLGGLSATHLGWVEALVDRPEPGLQRLVQASALVLVTADRRWPLHGYMTFRAIPEENDETVDRTLLLYRPGLRGGLMAFDDESTLARQLLATLHGAWPDALLESVQPAERMQLIEALSVSPAVTFEYPSIQSHFMQHCVQAIGAALPTDSTREQTRQRLCISENRARAMALSRFAEKNRSSHLQTRLQSLQHLDGTQRAAMATQVSALQEALRASQVLLNLSLPSRAHFARLTLHEHLRREFSLRSVPRITLDIADSVTLKREVTGQSALGGAGSRQVPVFSEARSEVALEIFMLWALDDERRHRLDNANIRLEPANEPALLGALTPAYIANLITRLDIAGAFEKRITQSYLGFEHETAWQVQWRQETLRAPYEHRLRLLVSSRPTSLRDDGLQLLEQFCSEQVETTATRTVRYHSLLLKQGTAADGTSDRVGLAGMHVIQGASGPVLLYIPGAPNGKIISQYQSTTAACKAVQDMALDSKMARYLADQCQSGDPDRHEHYINTALQRNFQSFITLGIARTESLPTHESRLEMGEHIRDHRATSRSQSDLALAAPEVASRHLFVGLRIALGILPGVGTAMALYDGWHAANSAASAFAHGNLEEGLEHLLSLLQSLTDAILSLAPLAAGPGKPGAAARLLTQKRQRLDLLHPSPTIRKTPSSPFSGYEAELPSGPMVRSSIPQGTGVFEHVSTRQRYIARNGAWYAVEWDSAYLTWRLKPQGVRSYRQPVRLSEQGIWETPGRLSGLLVDHGLAGGGGALTTLYNHGIAYWRMAIRRQPRQLTGMELAHELHDELIRIKTRMGTKQANYHTAKQAVAEGAQPTDAQHAAVVNTRQQLSGELNRSIDYNTRGLARLREHRATLSRSDYTHFIAVCEANISEMSALDMHLVSDRFILATEQSRLATAAIQALREPSAPAAQVKRLAQNNLRANQELIASLEEVERVAIRHHAKRNHLQGRALTDYLMLVERSGLTLDVTHARQARATILSASLFNASAVEHPQMGAFMVHFNEQGRDLRSSLFSHMALPRAALSRAQERSFLISTHNHYARFLSHLTAWQDTFEDLLLPNETRSFRQLMQQLIDEITDDLSKAHAARQRPQPQTNRGPSRPQLFETVEGPLIGSEIVERGQTRMHVKRPDSEQSHTIYVRNETGQWQLSAPERTVAAQSMASLVETANSRLNDLTRQQARLRLYQTPQAIPIDLEDIAQGHAQPLRFIADRIRQKAGQSLHPEQATLIQRLEAAAEQMQALGRQLRIAQTKASSKPTVGYLEYLLEQREVRVSWSRTLRPKVDRKGKPTEYLEEYRIDDLNTLQPLWYAHFHFRQRPPQGFTRLEAGHLKLASERNLSEGAWRGSISEPQANRLFGNLRQAS